MLITTGFYGLIAAGIVALSFESLGSSVGALWHRGVDALLCRIASLSTDVCCSPRP